MYLCYVDESGVSEIPGNSSHFVLAGLAIPIDHWREADAAVSAVMDRYGLSNQELHTAWLVRKYIEQSKIGGFDSMDWVRRRSEVEKYRVAEVYRVRKLGIGKRNSELKKNYKKTAAYIHLTLAERQKLAREIATVVSSWTWARLFAESINKAHFDPARAHRGIGEQAFEQVISRFEQFLKNTELPGRANFGLIIHDNNQTVAKKHTDLMRQFHARGTGWTTIHRIIETPLFVGSDLTRMVQIADLCSFAIRRYVENGEKELFVPLFQRGDKIGTTVVGIRHFTDTNCACMICSAHRQVNP